MKRAIVFATALWMAGATAFCAGVRPAVDKAELKQFKETLERILNENIIPFWYPGVVDRENGGYRLNHDAQGDYLGPAPRRLVTQARTLWFFARLFNSPCGEVEHLDAARHGYVFLRDRMWDETHGGFYLDVSSTSPAVLNDQKHLYAQSFALYALAEYVRASGDNEARALARRQFDTIDYRAHDPEHGGYREFFNRDWSVPPADSISFMGTTPDLKLYNTHLHLLEAITTYHRLTYKPVVLDRLKELLVINSNSVVRKSIGACTDRHQINWLPLEGPEYDIASYGHDIENVWLLMEACDAAGVPNDMLQDLYRTLYAYSLKYGFDDEQGGFYYTGPFNEPAENRTKSWWVQSEALVSALRMYEYTGETVYLDTFRKTLNWVVEKQVDWKNGDWHHLIDETGAITGGKAGAWKSPYHNGRAVLECLKTIEDLLR